MSQEELEARIDEANDEFIEDEEDVKEIADFVDIYQRDVKKARDERKKTRPRGSNVIVMTATKSVIDGDGVPEAGLARAYKRAKEDSELLKKRGERERADIVKRQYMQEKFLPAVETIIRFSSPDEILNCREALAALDKYALGVGDKTGYTASYIRTAYGDSLGKDLDNRFSISDPTVRNAVLRIRLLSANDEIRAAIGTAKQIKKAIDEGRNMASDDDYEIIGRVVAYGN